MGRQNRGAMSDWEFLRAASVEQRETEQAHYVAIKLAVTIEERRSIVNLRATAYEVAEAGEQRQLAAYSHEWPSAKVETFGAAVFQTLVRLTRLVEDCRRDEALYSVEHHPAGKPA